MTLRAAVLAPLAVLSGAAHAVTLFPAGTESKAAGMESALHAEGAPAALYNPANLRADDGHGEPYVEMGMINVDYSYEHPDFDPVHVVVTSPTATIGYVKAVSDRVTVGGVIFPSSAGKTAIPGLPRKVGSSVLAVELEAEDDVTDFGLGASVAVRDGVSLGVGLTRTHEEHKLKAALPDSVNPLIESSYKNDFNRPTAGVTWRAAFADAAFAYRPKLEKRYRGSAKSSVDEDASAPKTRGFEPETAALGVEGRAGAASLSAEAQRQRWSAGQAVFKTGIEQELPDADLHDVTPWSVTAAFAPPSAAVQSVSLAYAHLPTPWGDGRDTGDLKEHVYGVDFGQMNGVTLNVVSLGATAKVFGAELSLAAYRARGEREVTGTGDNVGFYVLDVTSVSASARKPF